MCDEFFGVEDVALEFDAVIAMGQSECAQCFTCLREINEGFDAFGIMFPELARTRGGEGFFVREVRKWLHLAMSAE